MSLPTRSGTPALAGRRAAFTFLEVLAASAILVLALLPLLQFIRSLTGSTRQNRTRVLAHHLASNLLERFRLEPIGALRARLAAGGPALLDSDPVVALPPGTINDLLGAYRMRRTLRVEPRADTPRVATLAARVDWVEERRPRHYELATLLVDPVFPGGRPDPAERGALGAGGGGK